MTREDAITILDCERPYGSCGCGATDEEIEEALDMAIEALQQNPYEPVENPDQLDCVNRQAVLDTLENMDRALDEDRTVESYKELLRECYKVLPSVSSSEKPNKSGKWTKSIWSKDTWECSECGWEIYDHEAMTNYCPSCGCRMVEPKEGNGEE